MTRRYPWAPLAAAMGLSPSRAAKVLHASGRYLTDGMSEPVADRMATKAGLATYEVWPEMVDHAIEDATRTCAAVGCDEAFMPRRKDQRYHSRRCAERGDEAVAARKARWERERYASNPAKRARRIETARAYYDQYIRAGREAAS